MSHILIPFLVIITTCLTCQLEEEGFVLAAGSEAPFHGCLCSWENTALVGASGEGLFSLSTVWKRQVETGLGDCRMALETPFLQTVPVFDNTSTLKIHQSDSIGYDRVHLL